MKSTYTSLERKKYTYHLYAFILLQVALLISIIINLSGINWYTYCAWEFGLLKVIFIGGGSTTNDIDHHIRNADTIEYIINTTCEHDDIYLDTFCDYFCGDVVRVQRANYQVITACSITMTISVILIGLYIYRIVRPYFRARIIVVIPIIQSGIYFLGLLLFMASIHYRKYVTIDCQDVMHCEDFTLKEGFIYYVINGIAMTLVCLYGFWKTRKAFLRS